ncbi:MAG: hypothetical protein R3D43_14495 [Tepidamorphaceae bacterium]
MDKGLQTGGRFCLFAAVAVPLVLAISFAAYAGDVLVGKIDRANAALECSFIAQVIQKKLDEVKYEEYREKETYLYGIWRDIAEEIRFPGPLLNSANQGAYVDFYEHHQPRTKVSLDFILGAMYSARMAKFMADTDTAVLVEADYVEKECDQIIDRDAEDRH